MPRPSYRLPRALVEEEGSMTLLMTGLLVVALVVVIPLVWNIGAVRAIGRQSQNGSDAAALAGAESVARRLSDRGRDWWGCVPPETPTTIVRRYLGTVVAPVAWSQIGRPAAQGYAGANGGSLSDYGQRLRSMGADGVHARLVSGVVIPPVMADVDAYVPVTGLVASQLYKGDGMPVPSGATAEAYLASVHTWQTSCPANPKAAARHYSFRWKVRLVKTGW